MILTPPPPPPDKQQQAEPVQLEVHRVIGHVSLSLRRTGHWLVQEVLKAFGRSQGAARTELLDSTGFAFQGVE